MAGRPPKEKSFANMLNIAIREAIAQGSDTTKLRAVADALVDKAMGGDVSAIKEVADRIDGKVPQAVVGDDEHDPVNFAVSVIERRLVRPNATD
jgi:hypothetical protein